MYDKLTVAFVFLSSVLYGCGNNDARERAEKISYGQENMSVILTTSIGTAFPQADAGSNSSSTPFSGAASHSSKFDASWEKGNGQEPRVGSPSESSVSGVEKVSGPFGPFPTETGADTNQSSVSEPTSPPESPVTPRSPFGPFPDSR